MHFLERFAVRLEYGARPRRRDIGIQNVVGHVFKVRAHLGEIPPDTYANLVLAPACEIEQMQRAELFINDGAGPSRSR